MKKIFILMFMVIALCITTSAEEHDVFLEFHGTVKSGTASGVNRSPMRLPIEVTYNSEMQTIKVSGELSLAAQVYLYNESGILENYSPYLNVVLPFLLSRQREGELI